MARLPSKRPLTGAARRFRVRHHCRDGWRSRCLRTRCRMHARRHRGPFGAHHARRSTHRCRGRRSAGRDRGRLATGGGRRRWLSSRNRMGGSPAARLPARDRLFSAIAQQPTFSPCGGPGASQRPLYRCRQARRESKATGSTTTPPPSPLGFGPGAFSGRNRRR